MNRRTFFAAIGAAVAGAKAKVWKPANSRPALTINRLGGFVPRMKIGDTMMIRKPPRFMVTSSQEEMLRIARSRFLSADELHRAYRPQAMADREFIHGPVPIRVFAEPTGDIPLASACECEEYDD